MSVRDKSEQRNLSLVVSQTSMYHTLTLAIHRPTHSDSLHEEMCRFILWFYVDGQLLPKHKDCFASSGYSWATDPILGSHVPQHVDAVA